MAKRKYEQRLRAEAADETRRRVLAAVDERLRAAPAEPVSIDRIARMAGVARSTIYLIFGSRHGLFDAFARDLFDRSGYARLIDAVRHEDAREHMRGGLRVGAEMFAANRDVFRSLYSMAQLDPDAVGGTVQRGEAERSRGMDRLAERLAEHGLLREDVSAAEAAGVLWVLSGFDTFDLLYSGRGLSLEDTVRTLHSMAERSLLADPAP